MKKDLNIIPYFMQNSGRSEMRCNLYYILLLWMGALMPVLSKNYGMNGGNGIIFFRQAIGCGVFVGVTYYCFLKIFRISEIAAMCAALYVLIVRRDGENLLVFTLLSLIWYELYKLATIKEDGKKRGISLGILALCLCMAVFLDMKYFESMAVLVIVMEVTAACLQKKIRFAVEMALTFVLAVPVMLLRMRSITDVSLIQENGGFFSDALLQFDVLLLGGFLGLLAFWLMGYLRNNKSEDSFLYSTMIAVAVMMFLSLRRFPWDRIQYLSGVTYKWIGLLESPEIFAQTALIGFVTCWGELLKRGKKYARQWYCLCTAGMLVAIIFTGIYAMEKEKTATDEIMRIQMQSGIEEITYEDKQE